MFNFIEENILRYSFRRRILVIVSLFLLLLSLLIGTISSLLSTSKIKDILFTQGAQWIQTLADNSDIAFIYKNGDAVNELVRTLMQNKSIEYIELIDDTGSILFQQGIKKTTLSYPINYSNNQVAYSTDNEWLYSVKVLSGSISRTTTLNMNNKIYTTDLLTRTPSVLLGYVNMRVSKLELKTARNNIFISNLTIAIFISLFLILVLHGLLGRLFIPFDKLSKTMTRIKQGEWIGLEGSPNIKELSSIYIAFNAMTKALKIRDNELQITNKNLEDIVQQRTRELEESNTELKSFNYSVSHDLRAPLRSISGFSKIILEDFNKDLPDDAQKYLERIVINVDRMSDLIDDMLMLSRISLQDINYQEVNLTLIITRIIDNYKFEHNDANINVILQPNLFIQADLGLMTIVMENLVGNALKYSSNKKQANISIGFSLDKENTLYISDNGVGFDMAFVGKLFSPFQRLHSSTDFEGSGVGLAIVKRIIKKHHGKVWIESETDKGTTVYIELNT